MLRKEEEMHVQVRRTRLAGRRWAGRQEMQERRNVGKARNARCNAIYANSYTRLPLKLSMCTCVLHRFASKDTSMDEQTCNLPPSSITV